MIVQGNQLGTIDGIPYFQGTWSTYLCVAGQTCPYATGDPSGTIMVESGVIDQAHVNHDTKTFNANGAVSVVVDTTIAVTDPVSTTISGAAIRISKGYKAGDHLSVTIGNGVPIGQTFADGTLVLSGVATTAQYSAVLQTLRFTTTATGADASSSREVTFTVGSGNLVQVNVQQQGVPQLAQAEYGYQDYTISYTSFFWSYPAHLALVARRRGQCDDVEHRRPEDRQGQLLGVPEWTGSLLYLDAQGHLTTTNTGTLDLVANGTYSDGRPHNLYVTPQQTLTFDQYGPNLITNGDFGLTVPETAAATAGRRRTSVATATTSAPTATATSRSTTAPASTRRSARRSPASCRARSTASTSPTAAGQPLPVRRQLELHLRRLHRRRPARLRAFKPGSSGLNFTGSFTFQATQSTQTLSFKSQLNGIDVTWSIDNVSCEPSTWSPTRPISPHRARWRSTSTHRAAWCRTRSRPTRPGTSCRRRTPPRSSRCTGRS